VFFFFLFSTSFPFSNFKPFDLVPGGLPNLGAPSGLFSLGFTT